MKSSEDFTKIVSVCKSGLFDRNKYRQKGRSFKKHDGKCKNLFETILENNLSFTDDNEVMFDNHVFNISYIILSSKPYRLGYSFCDQAR